MPSVSKLNNVKQVQHDEMIISMRRGNVGTSACSVRGFHSRKSRQSPQRFKVIFCEIREREIITLVFSSDAARNVPTPLTAHRSSLKSRCRIPSLQTADVWGTPEYHGFKNPRLFALTGIASFRRHYLYIITEKRKRLEDGNMNSRGLSSLRF